MLHGHAQPSVRRYANPLMKMALLVLGIEPSRFNRRVLPHGFKLHIVVQHELAAALPPQVGAGMGLTDQALFREPGAQAVRAKATVIVHFQTLLIEDQPSLPMPFVDQMIWPLAHRHPHRVGKRPVPLAAVQHLAGGFHLKGIVTLRDLFQGEDAIRFAGRLHTAVTRIAQGDAGSWQRITGFVGDEHHHPLGMCQAGEADGKG